ncbi:50S ribosomal protein L17 [Desulfobacteraceae bacterium SEEP-SAG9]|nr:50S ribosomal protein L17 [Desulfobacteraceae bacterium SEEP-SAG9]
MRHRKAGLKLNRTSSHRKAMFRNMVTSLFKYERIRTTDVKAKALRGWADHLITLAKRGDLHARRQALSIVREKEVVYKLFDEADKRFGSISGGYTRVVKLGRRPGDAAPISIIELVDSEKTMKKKAKKKAKLKVKKEPSAEQKVTVDAKDDTSDDGVTAAPSVEAPEALEASAEGIEVSAPAMERADEEKAEDDVPESTPDEPDAELKEGSSSEDLQDKKQIDPADK